LQQEVRQGPGKQFQLGCRRGIRGKQHEPAVPEVGRAHQARQTGREEFLAELRQRADLARFVEQGLQLRVGSEEAVDSGQLHGGRARMRDCDVQIILISDRLAKARTLSLSLRHLLVSAGVALALLAGMTAALYWLSLRFAAELKLPILQQIVLAAQKGETERAREFVQQNLNAMAVKLGEMQAQLTRLDALGERLSTQAGIRPQEFRFAETPGLGGAAPSTAAPQSLSLTEFGERLATLSRQMENRTDMLGVLEAQLFEQEVKKKLLPTMMPVIAPFNASGFGMRIDPFTGMQAMHEGIDFIADIGTPVVAAAGGVVQFAGFHPQYGNMIDIDHGNDLVTRYAHLSRMHVKEGAVVQRGRRIADTGNTGRSTGPHLHFEVRFRGAPQNPARFLLAASPPTPLARAK
jgi:murein DD-endopeptidase MepM/ murein hydrolase activator NlpD